MSVIYTLLYDIYTITLFLNNVNTRLIDDDDDDGTFRIWYFIWWLIHHFAWVMNYARK